jgi:molybdenum cofactor synthesis domain-containing protein
MSSPKSKGFKKLTKVDEAIKEFFDKLGDVKVEKEVVDLQDSLGRVLAEDVIATNNVPSFNKAAMDGYAVIAEDTFGASRINPVVLKVVGKIEAGEEKDLAVKKGEACYVATGAKMPEGADAVVMVEFTSKISNDEVEILRSVSQWDNVAKIGEDVKRGEVVLKKGRIIRPWDIGILAALGIKNVKVYKRPTVSVIRTGNELVSVGEDLKGGKIYDVNGPVLCAMINEAGAKPLDFGIVKDDLNQIIEALKNAIDASDIVLVTAGSSVGEKDFVPEAILSLGEPEVFIHGIALRPGAPTGLVVINKKPIILVPGYPVSAMVAFKMFVEPLIAKLMCTRVRVEAKVKARLDRRIAATGGLKTFLRLKLEACKEGFVAKPIRAFGAGVISSMSKADGYTIIPENFEGLEKGQEIEVNLLREDLEV